MARRKTKADVDPYWTISDLMDLLQLLKIVKGDKYIPRAPFVERMYRAKYVAK